MEPRTTRLIVALDTAQAAQARAWVDGMRDLKDAAGKGVAFKVGLELFSAAGPSMVRELVERGCDVFVDLKLHDIPNTVARAAVTLAAQGARWISVHLSGGLQMLEQTSLALVAEVPEWRARGGQILGVSVLTSFDHVRWQGVLTAFGATAPGLTPAHSVEGLVGLAQSARLGGIVCSPSEIARVRTQAPELACVVPGIRGVGASPTGDDQARTLDPEQAARLGADAIVVGRPITRASDPRRAASEILAALARAHVTQARVPGEHP